MDLIGHCAVAALSGVHEERDIFGPGIVELMLPNVVHCHDWGYRKLWNVASFDHPLRAVATQMRAHIVADWVVHYGDTQTSEKRKEGWAYRHMGLAHKRATHFFAGARSRDLLRTEATGPEAWSKKRKLDFAHSITEYALDFIVAPVIITPSRFADIKSHLAKMTEDGGARGRRWLDATSLALQIETDQPEEIVGLSVEALAYDAGAAEEPEAFAVGTTMRKYGFHVDGRSARYVRDFIEGIAAALDAREAHELCAAIGHVIAEPASIYTGAWRG
jgi:hypothetical protein